MPNLEQYKSELNELLPDDWDRVEMEMSPEMKSSVDRLEEMVDRLVKSLIESIKGGPGSGNFGHSGRPGQVGGSGGGGTGGDESGGSDGGKSDTTAASFNRDDWLEKPFMDRRNEWDSLPVHERDKMANARESVGFRIKELLGDLPDPPSSGNVSKDVEDRVKVYGDKIHSTSAEVITTTVKDMADHMIKAGSSPEAAHKLAMMAADVMATQEIEGAGRTLGDHGANHIKGDIDVAKQALAVVPTKTTDRDMAMLHIAAVFHDTGYLTPPSQIFLDEGHPRWSQEHFDENVRPLVQEALGRRAGAEVSSMIRSHDTKDINWKNEPVATALRIGDNAALFSKEKLPPVLRHVPGNVEALSALGRKEIDVPTCQARMRENIKKVDLPDMQKQRMMNAVAEVSPVLPKMALGMLGGELNGVEWKDGHVALHLKERPDLTDIHKVGDFGQRQFAKFAETYDMNPDQFKSDLNFKFSSGGRVVLEGIWDKIKAMLQRLATKGIGVGLDEATARMVLIEVVEGMEPTDLGEKAEQFRIALKGLMG